MAVLRFLVNFNSDFAAIPKYSTFPRNAAANGIEFTPNIRGGAGGQGGR